LTIVDNGQTTLEHWNDMVDGQALRGPTRSTSMLIAFKDRALHRWCEILTSATIPHHGTIGYPVRVAASNPQAE
jgi:hypothetical protein